MTHPFSMSKLFAQDAPSELQKKKKRREKVCVEVMRVCTKVGGGGGKVKKKKKKNGFLPSWCGVTGVVVVYLSFANVL
jgi:hypothetical protein